MRKKWLNHVNMILGAMSFGLLGSSCGTSSPECLYGPPPAPDKYGCPPEELIMAKYGVPYVEEQEEPVAPPAKEEIKK